MDVKTALTVVYAVIFIFALIGNVIVSYLVLGRPGMKSPTNLLLVNMAAADLLFAFFMVPLATIRYYVRNLWIGGPFGEFSCRAIFFMSHLPIAGSTTTLTFIAFERFFAIMFPYRRIKFFKQVKLITIIIWLSSALLMIPVGFAATTAKKNNGTTCDRNWAVFGDPKKGQQGFYLSTFVLMYAGPLSVMGILYAVICHKLWKHHAPGHVTASSQLNETIHRRQVVTMLIAIIIVFALCWLPTHAQHIIISYRSDIYLEVPLMIKVFMNLIGHANTAINPCLLISLNIRFRREFKRLFYKKTTIASSGSLKFSNTTLELQSPDERMNCGSSRLQHENSEVHHRQAWLEVPPKTCYKVRNGGRAL